jgi:glycosyltransferase involved in cell wall biosynthesis
MRVLFVIDGLGVGGAERSLAELVPGLDASGFDVTIACLHRRDGGVEPSVIEAGTDVRFLPSGPSAIRALRRIIRAEQPDIVHTTLLASNLVGRLGSVGTDPVLLTSLVNTPYVTARRADPRVRPMALSAMKLVDGITARRFTDHFHAITAAVKQWAVEDLRIDGDRITVVRRGRDAVRLGEPTPRRRAEGRRVLGLDPEDEVVVNVGREEYQKGQRQLVEAIASLAARRPRLKLLIAGRRGASSEELDRSANDLGLGDRVIRLGHRPDVADVLAAADVFAFPSRFEGLGGAVIEAMALGLPIVSTDLPAVREIVEEGRNALLVPPDSPRDLAVHARAEHRGHDRAVSAPRARLG